MVVPLRVHAEAPVAGIAVVSSTVPVPGAISSMNTGADAVDSATLEFTRSTMRVDPAKADGVGAGVAADDAVSDCVDERLWIDTVCDGDEVCDGTVRDCVADTERVAI